MNSNGWLNYKDSMLQDFDRNQGLVMFQENQGNLVSDEDLKRGADGISLVNIPNSNGVIENKLDYVYYTIDKQKYIECLDLYLNSDDRDKMIYEFVKTNGTFSCKLEFIRNDENGSGHWIKHNHKDECFNK